MQQNTVNSGVLWLGSRARQKAQKPTGKKQGPRSARASHSKSKPDRTTAHRSAQQCLTVFTAFCRARTQHRRHARQRLAPKCVKMSLAYIPPIPSKKTVLHGLRGFLEGSLGDADQALLKHHQAQPRTLMMSTTWPKPCIYAMFCKGSPQASKTASPSW